MALVDADNPSGSFVNDAGNTVTYTSTSTSEYRQLTYQGVEGAYINEAETHTHAFSEPVAGVQFIINASNISEVFTFALDGVIVDLNTLISSGVVTFVSPFAGASSPTAMSITAAGQLKGAGVSGAPGGALLTFNVPITTFQITGNGTGSGSVYDLQADTSAIVAPCFTSGTLIMTTTGEHPIETLCVGDRVRTMDHGSQPIQWIGGRSLNAALLAANPKLIPIRISAGALGANLPEQDLLVSPQHRVLVRSHIAERMFGSREVLVPANKFLTLDGINIAWDITEVTYWHILFDDHQIIWSNGAATETLFTGPEAIKSLTPEARTEIRTLFPDLFDPEYIPKSARPIPPKGKLMKRLVQRHLQNQKPIFEHTDR